MISARRKAELADELQRELDTVDRLEVEAKEYATDRRKEIVLHRQKVRQLRDLMAGREVAQALLPGTETGTVKPRPVPPPKKEPAGKSATGITWTAEDDDSRTGRSRSQARVYRVSAVRVTATGKLNWGWHLPGSALHHGGQSGYDSAPQAMAAAEKHELHHWPKEPKKAQPIVKKNAGPYRPKGEITRWVADERARKVPTFVIEQTGIRTKAAVIAKYGERAVFEKGKPCPRARDGLHSWERRPVKAAAGKSLPRLTADDVKDELCLDCGIAAGKPSPGCDGCNHPEPLDALVGSREDAVARHAAGKAVGA